MDGLFLIIGLVASFVLLDLASIAWGQDSREPMTDDHRR